MLPAWCLLLILVVQVSKEPSTSIGKPPSAPRPAPLSPSGFGDGLVSLRDIDCDAIPDLAVSAPLDSANRPEVGSLFIISGADRHVIHHLSGSRSGGRFGTSLSIAPDADLDGADDLLVGSWGDGLSLVSSRTGIVLRHFRDTRSKAGFDIEIPTDPGPVILCSARGSASDWGTSSSQRRRLAWLSSEVCTIGDADGDGVSDFAVGIDVDDKSANGEGEVVIRSGRDGSTIRRLRDPGSWRYFGFGWKVARMDDIDGDCVDDLLASSWNDGPVRVISMRTGKLLHRLWADLGSGNIDAFGASIACAGDLDGDGTSDIAVGCSEFPADFGDAYRVEVFSGRSGDRLASLDMDEKCVTVAEGRDFDLDGIPDIPIGLPELEAVWFIPGRLFRERELGPSVRWRGPFLTIRALSRSQLPLSVRDLPLASAPR